MNIHTTLTDTEWPGCNNPILITDMDTDYLINCIRFCWRKDMVIPEKMLLELLNRNNPDRNKILLRRKEQ